MIAAAKRAFVVGGATLFSRIAPTLDVEEDTNLGGPVRGIEFAPDTNRPDEWTMFLSVLVERMTPLPTSDAARAEGGFSLAA